MALKLDKDILSTVSKGYKVILVTGTNGKTTTTSMIYNMLKNSNLKVITNSTGANLYTGITSCFIENFSFLKSGQTKYAHTKYAVIEIDEANVKLVTAYITPEIITVTNLFRDQLDRYGEVYTTLKKILEGIEKVPGTKLILNGDESLLGDLDEVYGKENIYFGFNAAVDDKKEVDINADAKFCKKCKNTYKYEYITYNHLGKFYCENCGYKRPELQFHLDEITETTSEGSLVKINNMELYINQPGIYNIYNALCAFSVAKTLNIADNIISDTLKNQSSSFGRQELIKIDGKDTKIILVKNPAGYDQAIKTLAFDDRKLSIAFLLNDNYADGRDVSWIWDVNFEALHDLNIERVSIGGIRLYDMAIRLKIAGIDESLFHIENNYESLLKSIMQSSTDTIYILATYTAMISFRKFLNRKGYIKKLW